MKISKLTFDSKWLIAMAMGSSYERSVYLMIATDNDPYNQDSTYSFIKFDKIKVIRLTDGIEAPDLTRDGVDFKYVSAQDYDDHEILRPLTSGDDGDYKWWILFEAEFNLASYMADNGEEEVGKLQIIHATAYNGNPIKYTDFDVLQPTATHTLSAGNLEYKIILTETFEPEMDINTGDTSIKYCQILEL